jgi:hypothetical protein
MKVISKRCSMGLGRQIAFEHSNGEYIMVIDTDTIYYPILKDFVNIYMASYSDLAVQAILCGIFPRHIWEEIGGRRDLNIYEDVDMWIRIWKRGEMRWYPVFMGENIKDPGVQAGKDYLSGRYKKFEKVRRFIRREYDLIRTREVGRTDLDTMYRENRIDLELGEIENTWFTNKPKLGLLGWALTRTREFLQILRA